MFQDQDGCLDEIDVILSLHVMSLISTSVIASKLGPMLARIGLFRLKLKE
jgi:IAA-amino acid hydrolase